MIKLTSTALADFIAADEAEKRRVLQKYKYPRGILIGFYTAAITAVRRLHARVITPGEALVQASDLDHRARLAQKPQTKQRAENNARAIREYLAMAGGEFALHWRLRPPSCSSTDPWRSAHPSTCGFSIDGKTPWFASTSMLERSRPSRSMSSLSVC